MYSTDVEAVRKAMRDVISLGQKGVALSGEGYQAQTQFQFTGLAEAQARDDRGSHQERARRR